MLLVLLLPPPLSSAMAFLSSSISRSRSCVCRVGGGGTRVGMKT